MSFFKELKRRNVFRVGIAYLVVAWLVMQVADVVINNIGAPDWLFQSILLVLGVGFPVVLVFAWAFEMTPDGVKRESEVDRSESIRQKTGGKLDRAIIIILVIALGYFVWESRFHAPPVQTDAAVESVSVNTSNESINPSGPPSTVSDDKSVAVLPFVNMSSDPEQEYFSDGITEEIINALVKIPGLSVTARTSVFGFKGHQGDVRKIGLELGVDHILEGSIRSQGNQVRITAQLIKVDDGFHLWSETFDRKLDNIFVVQEEIAMAIAGVLTGELGFGVTAVPNQTRNMEAYDIYLQGRALLRKRDDLAVEVLEKATRADPGFAPGLAALAIAYQVNDMDDQAMQTAERALQIDPDNVDALDAMASALRTKMRWVEAESFYNRALAIDPQSSELLEDYAEFLSYTGQTEESLNVTTRGFAIDQNLRPLAMAHVEALTSNGRLDEALALADELASEHPGHSWIRKMQVAIHLAQGADVPEELLDRLEIPQDMLNNVTAILAAPHDDLAIERLKSSFSVEQIKEKQFVFDDWFLARVLLAYTGESDYVLDVDMGIIKLSSYGALEWVWTPNLKSTRKSPRFEKYLEMAGLIDYWDATQWPAWCERMVDGRVECQ